MVEEKIIGVSGPGFRIFMLAGSVSSDFNGVTCYTMDLSGFKVKKTSKESRCYCYRVKLSSKRKAKEERLVFGDRVLERGHYHYDDEEKEVTSRPVFESDCNESSLVAFDECTMYCISYCENSSHAHGSETLVQKIRLVDGGVEVERCLPTSRQNPQTLVLDGKLYVFGGRRHHEYPWSEFLDPVTGRWEVFTASPPSNCDLKFYPAIYHSRVLIISPDGGNFFLHDVDHPTCWKPYVSTNQLRSFRSRPLLVGSTIYWIDKHIYAYDFENKVSFSGFFSTYDLNFVSRKIPDEQRRLLHIGGDVFCLVWEGTGGTAIHFTRIRITKDYDKLDPLNNLRGNRIRISVISCSSKLTQGTYFLHHVSHVLLPDRVDGTNSTKELKLESACEGMPNKDASGSGSVLKRCKKRSVDSVKALSQNEGASLCEVVISKKLKLESACEEMPKTGKKLKPIKRTPIRNLWTCGGCGYKNIPQDMKCKGCHQVLKCNGCHHPSDSHAPNCPKLMGRWQCAKCKKFNLRATTECTGPDCKADKQFDSLLTGEDEVRVPKEAEIVAGEKKKLSKKSADDEFDFVGAAMKLNYLPLPKYKWIDPDLE